ncbi:MAG: hypothetical protein K2Y42_08705 [Hyphomicrobium sp.]|jgi:Flp pilus assembly protein TadB|uniref:hypothetical protein n=1 Tax=Hyphomicrobium sp. TaxID=82 RepID=UPI0025BAC97A|nr:hypothetical protein [Hyphomicrobium sp.]MBX9862819.1 hypothetical protein [Hyphomicrobium sp.]
MTFPAELGANEWMMIWGAGLALLGVIIMWRVSRYDLAGAAFDSAWQVARGKRSAETPTALEEKYNEIAREASLTGKAKRTAGTVIGHFAAKVFNLIAMLMLLAGAVLIALGVYWR